MTNAAELADPLDLPNGVRLPHRIAKAALSQGLADADNSPDERLVTLYRRWAQGGYGLLITGNVMIDRRHLGEPGNVVIEDDRALPQLTSWAKAAREGGAAVPVTSEEIPDCSVRSSTTVSGVSRTRSRTSRVHGILPDVSACVMGGGHRWEVRTEPGTASRPARRLGPAAAATPGS